MKSSEIQSAILDVIRDLDNDDGDVKVKIAKAREKMRGFKVITDQHRIRFDHAVRTGRLVKGSDVLPDFESCVGTPESASAPAASPPR